MDTGRADPIATDAARLVDGGALLGGALAFTRELRARGLAADLAAVLDFVRALDIVDLGERDQVYAAGLALFCRRHEDLERYERAFAAFWARRAPAGSPRERPPVPAVDVDTEVSKPGAERASSPRARAVVAQADGLASVAGAGAELAAAQLSWSAIEALRRRDFERMSAAELRQAELVIDRLRPTLEPRRTRRWELHRHGRLLAPRPMFRHSIATGGDPLTWLWRRRSQRPRPIVVICDISGSMERHARLLLRFAHALTRSGGRTEAFVFSTRLTRVTRQLRGSDSDRALERVSAAVEDWSGGTRIGEAFREFNQRWARRVLPTSGVVIVVSDGWDRGSAELVGRETERLRRNCHRLIWLDPLAGTGSGTRPLAAGMAAAHPHLDEYLPASDLASLESLAESLSLSVRRRPRRPPR